MTPPTIDQSVIERLSILLEAATLDRWKHDPIYRGGQLVRNSIVADGREIAYDVNDARDADLIVAMKNALPAILASISPSPIAGKEGDVVPYTGAVPPHWTPKNKYDRHPKTEADWDYRNDTSETRKDNAHRRLNFAMDFRDPRVDDQMTIVHRTDLLDVTHDLIHKNAYWEEHTTPPAECVATPGEVGKLCEHVNTEVARMYAECRSGAVRTYTTWAPDLFQQAATLPTQMEAREQAMREALGQATELIDEINLRAPSRQFNGINQPLHAKLCTIRATLARALLNPTPTEERP